MRNRSFELVGKISQLLRKRSFLLRLLTTTLIAVFVPLTIMSAQLVDRERQYVYQSAQAQLERVANTTVRRFDDFVDNMTHVNIKMLLASKLYDSVLSSGVQAQLEALELIGYYGEALPFVKDYALCLPETGEVYSLSGKLRTNGFSNYTLKLSESQFLELLSNNTESAGFVPWTQAGGNMLYIAPIRSGASRTTSRYGVYQISPTKLNEQLSTELGDLYRISSIYDGSGTLIYEDSRIVSELANQEGNWLSHSCTSRGGITACISTSQSALLQNVETLMQNAWRLSLLSIALSILLIVVAVSINYRPLARLVSRIRGEATDVAGPELDSILSSYAHLEVEKRKLTYELYEKHMMIADHIVENLLSGRKVLSSDLRLLKLNMPCYRVVCAQRSLVGNVAEIIERNAIGSPIYAIEMYIDNRLTFVCGCADDSETSLKVLQEVLRRLIRSESIPLGYSDIVESPDHLFMAYLEACKALIATSDTPDHMTIRLSGQQMYLLSEDPKTTSELASAIKSGDDFMIQYADESFERILSGATSRSAQRYACYQLVDLYRRLISTLDLALDMEQLSQTLQENSIQVLRERFIGMLSDLKAQRLQRMTEALDVTRADVIEYISDNFTDPLFSMNEVAEHLKVSIYTASRMLKTLTGINFRKYINDLRVQYARELLISTDLPVNDIAVRAGFTSASYFINIFKKTENSTPTSFRIQHKKDGSSETKG